MTADEFMEIIFNGTNNDSRVKLVDPETDGSWIVELDDGSEWRIEAREM